MTGFTLDATDCRILAVLQEDGRISNLDLAGIEAFADAAARAVAGLGARPGV